MGPGRQHLLGPHTTDLAGIRPISKTISSYASRRHVSPHCICIKALQEIESGFGATKRADFADALDARTHVYIRQSCTYNLLKSLLSGGNTAACSQTEQELVGGLPRAWTIAPMNRSPYGASPLATPQPGSTTSNPQLRSVNRVPLFPRLLAYRIMYLANWEATSKSATTRAPQDLQHRTQGISVFPR